jgi:hypothetical protein
MCFLAIKARHSRLCGLAPFADNGLASLLHATSALTIEMVFELSGINRYRA